MICHSANELRRMERRPTQSIAAARVALKCARQARDAVMLLDLAMESEDIDHVSGEVPNCELDEVARSLEGLIQRLTAPRRAT